MVRSLHRLRSRCRAGASAGRTTRKGISTPLGRVSVWSFFMPVILYACCHGRKRYPKPLATTRGAGAHAADVEASTLQGMRVASINSIAERSSLLGSSGLPAYGVLRNSVRGGAGLYIQWHHAKGGKG